MGSRIIVRDKLIFLSLAGVLEMVGPRGKLENDAVASLHGNNDGNEMPWRRGERWLTENRERLRAIVGRFYFVAVSPFSCHSIKGIFCS